MKIIIAGLLLFGTIFFQSCTDKNELETLPKEKTIEDLVISDQFNFETTTDQNLKITLPYTVDYTDYKSKISIYSASEDEGGVLIANVTTNDEGVFEGDLSIPSSYDSLYIKTHAGEVTVQLSGLKSVSTGGIIDFGEDYEIEPPFEGEINETQTKSATLRTSGFSGLKTAALANNVIANGGFDDDNFGTMSSWKTPNAIDETWYLSSGSYYPQAQRVNDNGNFVMRLQSTYYYYGGIGQMIDAEPGDVITFSADYKGSGSGSKRGYLYLIPRNASGRDLAFYSVRINGVNTTWKTKTIVATMPPETESCEVLIWSYARNSYIYWDNVVVTGPVTDSDNDGVSDDDDEYPNDASRAFNIYYPNKKKYASIGFEDNWPGTGDYDFNDLVVDYQYKQVVNSNNQLVDLQGKYVLKAIGASYHNGFGFQIKTDPDSISEVSGSVLNQGYVSLNANGTEAGQNKANIIVFEDAYDILQHPGGSIGVNTEIGATYIEPDTITVDVSFVNPVTRSSLGSAPFNPYMSMNQEI